MRSPCTSSVRPIPGSFDMSEESKVVSTSMKHETGKHGSDEQAVANNKSKEPVKCTINNKSATPFQHESMLKTSSSTLPEAAPSNVECTAAGNMGMCGSDSFNEIERILRDQADYFRVLKVDQASSSETIKLRSQELMRTALASKCDHPNADEAVNILCSARSTLLNVVTKKLYKSFLVDVGEPQRNGASLNETCIPRRRVYHLPRYMRIVLRTPILGLLSAIFFMVIMIPIVLVLLLLLSIWYLAFSPVMLLLSGDPLLPEPDISDTSSLVQPSEAAEAELDSLKEQDIAVNIVSTQTSASQTKAASKSENSSEHGGMVSEALIPQNKLEEASTTYMDLVSHSLSKSSSSIQAGPAKCTESNKPYDYGLFKPMEIETSTSLSDHSPPRAMFKQFNARPFLFHTYGGSGKRKNPHGLSLYNTYSGSSSSHLEPWATDARPMYQTIGESGSREIDDETIQQLTLLPTTERKKFPVNMQQ